MKKNVRKNSLAAFASLKLQPIERSVLWYFKLIGGRTDREVTRFKGNGSSMQPRITYLLKKKLLREVSGIKCATTGRTVRVCEITKKGIKALEK